MIALREAARAKAEALQQAVAKEEAAVADIVAEAARSKLPLSGDYWTTLRDLRERLRVARAIVGAVEE